MVYALWQYRVRTAQILRKDSVRYDDQNGPVVLTALLVLVVVVAYVFAVHAYTAA